MTKVEDFDLLNTAIAKIDARRALTGAIDTEYRAKLLMPDGRAWRITVSPVR